MKSLLVTVTPKILVKLLNGDSSILIRKKFPKDYVGWVYLYCSNKHNGWCMVGINGHESYYQKYSKDATYAANLNYIGNGKVVARFWCDKVEHLIVSEDSCGDAILEVGWSLIEQTCLTEEQICRYIGKYNIGFAIYLTNEREESTLEIFDRPRELSEFYKGFRRKYYKNHFAQDIHKEKNALVQPIKCGYEYTYPLTKAPQNFCYVEVE